VEVIPFPSLTIVMTDASGGSKAWQVPQNVFEEMAAYLESKVEVRSSEGEARPRSASNEE